MQIQGVGEILHTICEVKSVLVRKMNPDYRIPQLLIVSEKLMYKNLASKYINLVDFADRISVELMIQEFIHSLPIRLQE